MLDTATKRRSDDCRDILVGKLPDPKAQIEQITIGLIYKFMDDMDKEAVELGGKAKFFSNYSIPDPKDLDKQLVVEFEKYSWDNLFDAKVTATEMLTLYAEAIAGMDKNPNIPQLFRDIFKNAYLPYRDPETLKMFLKTINEFEYSHSEKLGDAFEYLLSVMGSQGDAGQFRTPRHIIDFLVAAVNPDKTDTILDPACGTAGFLISAFKHIKEQNNNELTPDERKKLIQNFVGYDISPDMVRLSLVNLYLHGFSAPHIWEYDTLSSEERWNENFDVVLANPPFMSPKGGIRPHKKFSIASNRSEVLFVDYIAEHLNPKGRAGIIVPEGVIFQSGTAYKDLRKMLVDNYLYAVVSLPAGVFNPYSGVKTSILLMDKELAKTNDTVLFVKVANDGYGLGAQRNAVKGGQLDDAIEILNQFKVGTFSKSEIAHIVQKSVIAEKGDYNLSGERYKDTDQFKMSSVEIVTLDDVAKIEYGYTDTAKDEGDARFIRITDINEYGQLKMDSPKFIILNKEANKYLLKKDDILVARTGATFGKTLIYDKNETAVFASFLIRINVDTKKVLPKYYWAFAQSDVYWNQANNLVTGGGQPQFNGNALKQIQIPLPPLSVQEEIVAEIEGYQKIIDGAKMVVENYKPKIEIDPEWEMSDLGTTANITTGKLNANQGVENGKYPFFTCSKSIYYIDNYAFDSKALMLSGNNASATYDVKYYDGKFNAYQRTYIITIKPQFEELVLYPFLQNMMEQQLNDLKSKSVGGLTKYLTLPVVKDISVPIPPIDIQRKIVAKLENEQSLVNANKELIAIFEQKIKDRIAKVWGA